MTPSPSLSLAAGLRALAEEGLSQKLRRPLQRICHGLEKGESLEELLEQNGNSLPSSLRGIIASGCQTGQLALLIEKQILYARNIRDIKRQTFLQLAYPSLLLMAMISVFYAMSYWIVPAFAEMFDDFGVELPAITVKVITFSQFLVRAGFWLPGGLILAVMTVWFGIGIVAGRARRQRWLEAMPFVGSVIRYSSLSQFCHLLATLVESKVLLPEALRLTAESLRNPNLREGCRLLAEDVERGLPLEKAAEPRPHFQANVANIFRWEPRDEAFPEALHAAGDLYLAQSQVSAGTLGIVLEPIVLFGIAFGLAGVVIAMFLPLIKLLNALS